jgi:hypothetical protein
MTPHRVYSEKSTLGIARADAKRAWRELRWPTGLFAER